MAEAPKFALEPLEAWLAPRLPLSVLKNDGQRVRYVLGAEFDRVVAERDRLMEAAKAVDKRITPTMEGSVDGDYLGGAMYHSDPEIKVLRAAVAACEEKADG